MASVPPKAGSRCWNLNSPGLAKLGIELETVAQQLEEEGVKKFVEPFDKLLASLEQRRLKLALVSNDISL